MDTALAALDTAISGAAAVDLEAITPSALAVAAVELQGCIDRLTLVHAVVVSAADSAGVWAGSGCRGMADWLAQQTKTSYGDATDRVKLGDTLELAPGVKDAVESGEMSTKTALALHGAVKDAPAGADVGELVDAVKGATPREAAAAGEKWREVNSTETPEQAEDRRYRRRSVRSGQSADGLVTTTVVLPAPEHRQFINAITHAAGDPYEGDERTTEQRLADGLVLLSDAYAKGTVTGGRERPTMLLVIDGDEVTTGHGDRIPPHVAARIAENAHLQKVLRAGSEILALGRTVRYASEAQYKALVVRDGGCRWPGCQIPAAWCEIDHLTPWEHGGTTDLDNLVMWCTHHHHEKHRPGVRISGTAAHVVLTLANGTVIDCPVPERTRTRTTAAA